MLTITARQRRLRRLMRQHRLTPQQVGEILYRNPSYVRSWHAGINPIPPEMLRLLELEIQTGERIERIKLVASSI